MRDLRDLRATKEGCQEGQESGKGREGERAVRTNANFALSASLALCRNNDPTITAPTLDANLLSFGSKSNHFSPLVRMIKHAGAPSTSKMGTAIEAEALEAGMTPLETKALALRRHSSGAEGTFCGRE